MSLGKQVKTLNKGQVDADLGYLASTLHPDHNRAIVLRSVEAGLRTNEIACLCLDMVTNADGHIEDAIHLRYKVSRGRSSRVIPMNKELRSALILPSSPNGLVRMAGSGSKLASGTLGKRLGDTASRLALALALATTISFTSQAQQPPGLIQMGTSFDCARMGTGQSIPALVCQTPELQIADLHQMQAYYTLRHAQPQRQQELRNQFTSRIQALVRECSTEQVRASGSQPACVAQALGNLRHFWLEQLQQTGNAAALEEARLPSGNFIGSQQALRTSGFLPANTVVDGVYGSATREAIARFQAERGIAASGFLTQPTLAAIRLASISGARTAVAPGAAGHPAPPVEQQSAVSTNQITQSQPAQRAQSTSPSTIRQNTQRSANAPVTTDNETAEQLAAALRALEARDYATALRVYRTLAERGVAAAQGGMARLLLNGWGVDRNEAEAVRWARLGATQNDPTSQAGLGFMYMQGRGVARDDAEAVRWYRMAAEQGNASGQSGLGFAFMTGRGVPRDNTEAVRWLRMAAAQEDPAAQALLGTMYWTGRGAAQDYREAAHLFNLASNQGNSLGQLGLGIAYNRGLGRNQDFREAFRLFSLASTAGNARAQAELGDLYYLGNGVARDFSEAVRLFRLSSEQNDTRGTAFLGTMLLMGLGVPRDVNEGVRLYRRAAERGDAFGQAALASAYLVGLGVERNYAEALRLARESTAQSDAHGEAILSIIYLSGFGVDRSFPEAIKLARLAAQKNNADGQAILGMIYKDGLGVEQNYAEAIRWLRLSADQNNSFGQFLLGNMFRDGLGVQQNDREAVRLYRLAAELNDSRAQNALGEMHRDGRGIPRDLREAVRLFGLSAEQDDPDGQNNLGLMYRDGQGIVRNLARARELFTAAARSGHAEGQASLAAEEDRSLARFASAPFQCSSNDTITCVVTENGVFVRDITINRGNCPSAAQQSAAIGDNPFVAFADVMNRATAGNIQLNRVPQMFNFGGGFTFKPFGCPNILEYVIVANGQSWTFRRP